MDMEKERTVTLTKEEATAPTMRKWYLPDHSPVFNPKKAKKVLRVCNATKDNEKQFPNSSSAVKRNFYMDTFFKSVKANDQAPELQQELVEILNEAAFHLTK